MAETWTDEQMLTMLDLRDGEGLSASQIALRMRTSRSAILGVFYRVDTAHAAMADETTRPENRDGALPRGWWKRGRMVGRR